MRVAIFSTHEYDRSFLSQANSDAGSPLRLEFHETHLTSRTALLAAGAEVVYRAAGMTVTWMVRSRCTNEAPAATSIQDGRRYASSKKPSTGPSSPSRIPWRVQGNRVCAWMRG